MNKPISAALGMIGVLCTVGAIGEIGASLAPQLLPDVIRQGLETSFYRKLHADPLVSWWVRLHNVVNLVAGVSLVVAARRIWRGDMSVVKHAQALLGWFVIAAAVGAVLLVTRVFPIIDSLAEFPVPPEAMKASMILGPVGLAAFCVVLIALLQRWNSSVARAADSHA